MWIWSKEFRFAERLFDSFQEKARDTWEHSKRRPKSAAASPLCGLAVAAAAFWAAGRYQVLDDVKGAVGL